MRSDRVLVTRRLIGNETKSVAYSYVQHERQVQRPAADWLISYYKLKTMRCAVVDRMHTVHN